MDRTEATTTAKEGRPFLEPHRVRLLAHPAYYSPVGSAPVHPLMTVKTGVPEWMPVKSIIAVVVIILFLLVKNVYGN